MSEVSQGAAAGLAKGQEVVFITAMDHKGNERVISLDRLPEGSLSAERDYGTLPCNTHVSMSGHSSNAECRPQTKRAPAKWAEGLQETMSLHYGPVLAMHFIDHRSYIGETNGLLAALLISKVCFGLPIVLWIGFTAVTLAGAVQARLKGVLHGVFMLAKLASLV